VPSTDIVDYNWPLSLDRQMNVILWQDIVTCPNTMVVLTRTMLPAMVKVIQLCHFSNRTLEVKERPMKILTAIVFTVLH